MSRRSRRVAKLAAVALAGLCALPGCSAGAAAGSGERAGPAGRSAAGEEAWVATAAFQSGPGDIITPVDLATHRKDPVVTTASEPSALASTPGGRDLLVTNQGNDTLSVLDAATGTVTATVTVGLEPDAVAVAPATAGARRSAGAGGSPGAGTALVADFGAGMVTPIDLATLRAGPPIPVGDEPDAIGIVARGPGGLPVALVCDYGSDALTPVAMDTLAAGASIPVPGNPTGIAVEPGGAAWIVGGATLTPVTPATLAPGKPVSLPGVAEAVALEGAGTAWVAEQGGTLVPVTLPAGPVGRGVRVGGRPSAVTIPSG